MSIDEVVAEIRLEMARNTGIEKGREEGRVEGREEGRVEGVENTILAIIKKHPNWSDEKIADLVDANIDMVKKVRATLS